MRKLTKPQAELLAEIVVRPRTVAPNYAPVRKLADAGLIIGRECSYGSWTWSATDAGRAALKSAGETDA